MTPSLQNLCVCAAYDALIPSLKKPLCLRRLRCLDPTTSPLGRRPSSFSFVLFLPANSSRRPSPPLTEVIRDGAQERPAPDHRGGAAGGTRGRSEEGGGGGGRLEAEEGGELAAFFRSRASGFISKSRAREEAVRQTGTCVFFSFLFFFFPETKHHDRSFLSSLPLSMASKHVSM